MSLRFRRLVFALTTSCFIIGLVILMSTLSGYILGMGTGQHHWSNSRSSDNKQPKDRLYRSSQYLPPRLLLTSEERISNLKKRCLQYKKRSWSDLSFDEKRALSRQIIVDDGHRILYCFFPKVACSNWKRVFSVLAGEALKASSIRKIDHKNFHFLSDYPPLGMQWRLNTYYKFMFVREPLERLVSAYKDKFLVHRESFFKRWGSKIIKKFRKKRRRNKDNLMKNIPSLNEFFRFLVSSKPLKMDVHWMPYKEMSQPCAVEYNFIGSFDTLESDARRVLHQLQVDDKVQFPGKQSYYNLHSNQTGFDSLISKVPKPLLKTIVEKYIQDYELFSFPLPLFGIMRV